jgi:DNA-binding NarL/FixJ family response regulator
MQDIRIGLVDDHDLYRGAIAASLRVKGAEDVVEAGSLSDLAGLLVGGSEIDLVLVEPGLPSVRGVLDLLAFRNTFPFIPIIVLTGTCDPPMADRYFLAGAAGVVLKSGSAGQIRIALRAVLAGNRWLGESVVFRGRNGSRTLDLFAALRRMDDQDLAVCGMLADRMSVREIASSLQVDDEATHRRIAVVLNQLKVGSTASAGDLLKGLIEQEDKVSGLLTVAE